MEDIKILSDSLLVRLQQYKQEETLIKEHKFNVKETEGGKLKAEIEDTKYSHIADVLVSTTSGIDKGDIVYISPILLRNCNHLLFYPNLSGQTDLLVITKNNVQAFTKAKL